MLPEKIAYYAFSSAHFFRNYAKIMLLSENYATYILRKAKITSTILTLMNIHIVQSCSLEDRKYACAHLEKPND